MRTAVRRMNGATRGGAKSTPRFNAYQNPTPQGKMINTNKQFGINIKKQQGSTLIFNDTVLLTQGLNPEGTTFTFFLNAKMRQFPMTNLQEGKLGVGESLVVERTYLYVITETAATGEITAVQSLDAAALDGLYFGVMNMLIENSQIIKPIPLLSMMSAFNRYAGYSDYNVFHFETDLIIPQLLYFQLNIKAPAFTVPSSETLNYYLGCSIEGHAAILSPRANF